METIRFFLVVTSLIAFNGSRLFGSNIIKYKRYNYERQRNATAVIGIARKELGVREVSENSSARIDQYAAYVGFKKIAWCSAFVSWCFHEVGFSQPKTAWSPALFPDGRLARSALPGHVFGIYFSNLKRIAHVGIVEVVKGDFCVTIEGNTNVTGSREGDAVMRKLRHKRTIAKYADWYTYQN